MPFKSQNNPFIFIEGDATNASKAVIILPDIFSFNHGNLETLEMFAKELDLPIFGLDYFYEITGQNNELEYTMGSEAVSLMQKMTGENFVSIFNKAVEAILNSNPTIQEFTVIGFCFGGRLAYLSGLNNKVSKVISFYGSRMHDPVFYQAKSAVASLCLSRNSDKNLKVLALFGEDDASTPDIDLELSVDSFKHANIYYKEVVYPNAGHAFFAKERPVYNKEAYDQALEEVKNFIILGLPQITQTQL